MGPRKRAKSTSDKAVPRHRPDTKASAADSPIPGDAKKRAKSVDETLADAAAWLETPEGKEWAEAAAANAKARDTARREKEEYTPRVMKDDSWGLWEPTRIAELQKEVDALKSVVQDLEMRLREVEARQACTGRE